MTDIVFDYYVLYDEGDIVIVLIAYEKIEIRHSHKRTLVYSFYMGFIS